MISFSIELRHALDKKIRRRLDTKSRRPEDNCYKQRINENTKLRVIRQTKLRRWSRLGLPHDPETKPHKGRRSANLKRMVNAFPFGQRAAAALRARERVHQAPGRFPTHQIFAYRLLTNASAGSRWVHNRCESARSDIHSIAGVFLSSWPAQHCQNALCGEFFFSRCSWAPNKRLNSKSRRYFSRAF